MGYHGLMKQHHAIGKGYAWQDWYKVAQYAESVGCLELVEAHRPGETFGTKRIDRSTAALLRALGVSGRDLGLNAGALEETEP